jgi:hypothetical protein
VDTQIQDWMCDEDSKNQAFALSLLYLDDPRIFAEQYEVILNIITNMTMARVVILTQERSVDLDAQATGRIAVLDYRNYCQ